MLERGVNYITFGLLERHNEISLIAPKKKIKEESRYLVKYIKHNPNSLSASKSKNNKKAYCFNKVTEQELPVVYIFKYFNIIIFS